jgi:hypothetical protein
MDFFEGQPAFLSLPLKVCSVISFCRLKPAYLKYLITEIITFNLPIVQCLYFSRNIMNNVICSMPIKFVSHVLKLFLFIEYIYMSFLEYIKIIFLKKIYLAIFLCYQEGLQTVKYSEMYYVGLSAFKFIAGI